MFTEIQSLIESQSKYRLIQIKNAIFKNLITDWNDSTTLPKELKEQLNTAFPLDLPAEFYPSSDGKTVKALMTLRDGAIIEAVLMLGHERQTVCVSSQVGCANGCTFCATGDMGFTRNLTVWEIVAQVILFNRYLKSSGQHVSNVVVMGMGEPFSNYKNVIAAIKTLNEKDGFNLGWRRMSVSTCGLPDKIRNFSREPFEVNLALSLHAPTDKIRSTLMPINQRYPLSEVMSAIDEYIDTTRRKVMFEYMLIKGVNDSDSCAYQLASILKGKLAVLNLIPYNPTSHTDYVESDKNRIKQFKSILDQRGINVTERFRHGRDISAACGQLAADQQSE